MIAQVIDNEYLTQSLAALLDANQNLHVILAGFTINIIVSLILLFVNYRKDIKLKDKDKEIYQANIYANKRIDIYEKLYVYMNSLQDALMTPKHTNRINKQIKEFTDYYMQNGLFIESATKVILDDFKDYCMRGVQDYSVISIKEGEDYLDRMKNSFYSYPKAKLKV